MDDFIVSARKYRPVTFDTVVGQGSITTTLKNAIRNNHIAHAYLFCGPRGVGKTTCARIFAKTLNCVNRTETIEACNRCESCKSFNEQRSYSIHELDAASNNSVDDIRSLIEQVRIPPQIGKHSVYIIDEVHMLSTSAFNAFLKTLEEPPTHAIFVLATTEKHKILPTILSRCQIFDFSRITVKDTIDHLKGVAAKEGITAEEEALNVISQKSDGGMRDALSIFDQMVSCCGTNFTYKQVIDNLNVLDYDYYFRLTNACLDGRIADTLMLFNEILNKGFDAQHFVSGLSSHFRDLLVSKDASTLSLLEVGASTRLTYQQQAGRCPEEFLIGALDICNAAETEYRTSRNKRLVVELMLIRLAQLPTKKKIGQPVKFQIDKIFDNATALRVTHVTGSAPSAAPAQMVIPAEPKPQNSTNEPTPEIIVNTPPTSPRSTTGMGIPGGFSIKATLSGSANNIQTPLSNNTNLPDSEESKNDPVSSEMLKTAWMQFIAQNNSEKLMLCQAMRENMPEISGGHIIEVKVSNNILQQRFVDENDGLVNYLRNALNNNKIKLNIQVINIPDEDNFETLSPQARLKQMFELNPALKKLADNLNLEQGR